MGEGSQVKDKSRLTGMLRKRLLVYTVLPWVSAFVLGGACIPTGQAPGPEAGKPVPFEQARISLALPDTDVVLGQVANVLTNSGFERGDGAGWVQWAFPKGDGYHWSYPDSDSAEGTYHGVLVSSAPGDFGLYQVVDTEPGRTYEVAGYMKARDHGANRYAILLLDGDVHRLASEAGMDVGEYIVQRSGEADIMAEWRSDGGRNGRPGDTWTYLTNRRRASGTQMTLVIWAGGAGVAALGRFDGLVVRPAASAVIRWTDVGVADGEATVWLEVQRAPTTGADQTGPFDILIGRDAAADGDADLFEWFGLRANGTSVPAGTYRVRASLMDDLGELDSSEAQGRVIIPFVFSEPLADVVLAGGATYTVAWTDEGFGNGDVVRLVVDADADHTNGDEITILTSRPLDADEAGDDEFEWDGRDVDGVRPSAGWYFLVAVINPDGSLPIRVTAPGRIRLANQAPTVVVSQPAEDQQVDTNGTVLVAWTADDPDDDATIVVWYDADEDATFDRNNPPANIIRDGISEDNGPSSVDWDTTGVAEGTYSIFVTIDDGVNEPVTDAAPGRITVPNAVPQLTFTEPADDVSVTFGSTTTIAWTATDPEDDARIDLYVDLDADHDNGNETLILEDRQENDGEDDFAWDPTGLTPGRYFVFARIDDGVADPTRPVTVEATGTIAVQADADDPTIVLTEPAGDLTAVETEPVEIRWDDQNTSAEARIALRYDDDPRPDQGGAEINEPERTIQTDLPADPDGDQDRHLWDWHPEDITQQAVPAGEYYLFAYIDDDGDPLDGTFDALAVAIGKVTIPNTAPELAFVRLDPDADGDYGNAFDLAAEDAEVVPGTSPRITWNDRDPDDDAQITLWLDADEDHDNGNEVQLFQVGPVSEDLDDGPGGQDGESQYDWQETRKADGSPLEDRGQYTLFARIDDGQGHAELIEAVGKINFRDSVDQPVVVITSQAADVSVDAGDEVTVTWRDLHVSGNETITIVYDDDGEPDEPAETGQPEQVIQEGILAVADGSADSVVWDTAGVASGAYYIHVKILDGGVVRDTSTSVGRVTVTGPNEPPTITVTSVGGVPVGGPISIEQGSDPVIAWVDSDPEEDARISLLLRPDGGGTDIVLVENVSEDADGADGSFTWTGTRDKDNNPIDRGFYTLIARIEDGVNDPVVSEVPGRILLRDRSGGNWGPLIRLTEPVSLQQVDLGDAIMFRWEDDDPDDAATIELKYDDDEWEGNGSPLEASFVNGLAEDPDGADQDGYEWIVADIPPGQYYIHAVIEDGLGQRHVATAPGRVEVRNTTPTLSFLQPSTLTTLGFDERDAGGRVSIEWISNDPDAGEDAQIILGIDPDENHTNGNEWTIAEGLTDGNGAADILEWDLTDTAAGDVNTGWFFVFGVIDDGIAPAVRVTAPGKVVLRKQNDVPTPSGVVVLTEPVEGLTKVLSAGQRIRWEDDDPDPDAVVRVSLAPYTREGEAADVSNAGGTYTLTDATADFVGGGVEVGDTVAITRGTGAVVGTYEITAVTTTSLTLAADAGDSAGAGNVHYLVGGEPFLLEEVEAAPDGVLADSVVVDGVASGSYYVIVTIGQAGGAVIDDYSFSGRVTVP